MSVFVTTHGGLLPGFRLAVEMAHAVDCVDRRHHEAEPVVMAQRRLCRDGGEDRQRVGKARAFDHEPPVNRDFAPRAPRVQRLDRIGELPSDRATQAARLQQHRVFVDPPDELVVEADLAEFVDQDRRVGERGRAQHALKQRRLARPEEA
jgi:hypothetical protein